MNSVLTFRCRGARCAVDADAVLEVVELPALSPWPGSPQGMVGVVDYRGEVIPVLDVSLRLGGGTADRDEMDQLIVVRMTGGGRVALLVEEAVDLRPLQEFRPLPESTPSSLRRAAPYLLGVVTIDDHVVLGVNIDALAAFDDDVVFEAEGQPLQDASTPLMAERARELAVAHVSAGDEDHRPLVVVRLSGERLGIPVDEIAALTHCPAYTPVPGSPSHLLGLAYHRGGLLRLVDIRALCGLEITAEVPGEVVVLSGPGMPTGLVVDSIESIASVEENGAKVAYGEGWLTVLDLDRLDVREPRPQQAVGP